MIITRTPYRVSLFGGGTDYPEWFMREGRRGAVLGFALDKYCWITLRRLPPFFEHRHRIVYSKVETVTTTQDIEHPAAREVIKMLRLEELCPHGGGIEMHHDGDLPAWSGMGSSSAFAVGLLNAVFALAGMRRSNEQLANSAIHLEREVLHEAVGWQDQVWAAHGGLNRIDFNNSYYNVSPLVISARRRTELLSHLALYYTGQPRKASDVATAVVANLVDRAYELERTLELVDEADAVLLDEQKPIDELGRLLREAWQLKRQTASVVTNAYLDDVYKQALGAGALAGKVLGAGGGGFMLFLVRPQDQAQLAAALHPLLEVPVGIDREGSRVVLYEPEGWG